MSKKEEVEFFTKEEKALIQGVKTKMRITKVVCTRSIKTGNGDYFVGFSAAHNTIQEDAGGMGSDLLSAQSDNEESCIAQNGMTLKEAKLAGYLLALQTDLQAQSHALAGGGISESDYRAAQANSKRNYLNLMRDSFKDPR